MLQISYFMCSSLRHDLEIIRFSKKSKHNGNPGILQYEQLSKTEIMHHIYSGKQNNIQKRHFDLDQAHGLCSEVVKTLVPKLRNVGSL